MFIKDMWGDTLILSKTRLSECASDEWYLRLANFPELTTEQFLSFGVRIYAKGTLAPGEERCAMTVQVGNDRGVYKIGCHSFDRKTFRIIQKAAAVARKAAKK